MFYTLNNLPWETVDGGKYSVKVLLRSSVFCLLTIPGNEIKTAPNMKTFISILRGINVSGQKKILMNDLKALYEELEFKNVTTYIQSGNVIFSSSETDSKTLPEKIGQKIFEKYNFNVPVILRTVGEMKSVAHNNPFQKEKNADTDKLYVTFFASKPGRDNIKKIMAYHYEPEKFILTSKEVYLSFPNRYGNAKLNNNFFENKLKVTATTRNWRTVNELLKIALTT